MLLYGRAGRLTAKNGISRPGQAADGEYLTRVELASLVAYASARGVRVVPELDLPGHATALLLALPELGPAGARPARLAPTVLALLGL